MKSVIVIHDYYQNIYITLGAAINKLLSEGKQLQVDTLMYRFNKCESHGQCMEVISQFVDIIQKQEA